MMERFIVLFLPGNKIHDYTFSGYDCLKMMELFIILFLPVNKIHDYTFSQVTTVWK